MGDKKEKKNKTKTNKPTKREIISQKKNKISSKGSDRNMGYNIMGFFHSKELT